jgi:hypothetical protein
MIACVGVIFQFNPTGVLFEFSNGVSEDNVGIVEPTKIKIGENETIPASANTVDLLSKYIQVSMSRNFLRPLLIIVRNRLGCLSTEDLSSLL